MTKTKTRTISTTKTMIDPKNPSAALEPVREILNPLNGELVPVSDRAKVAEVVEAINEAKRNLSTAYAAIVEAMSQEAGIVGSRTFHGAGVKLSLSADSELEWDVEALGALRKAGLPEERMNELLKTTVTYSVNGAVARQVASANPQYKAIIEAAKIRKPKRASLRVERIVR